MDWMIKDEGFTPAQADFPIQEVLWTLQGYGYGVKLTTHHPLLRVMNIWIHTTNPHKSSWCGAYLSTGKTIPLLSLITFFTCS